MSLLDFIENFYQRSVADVASAIARCEQRTDSLPELGRILRPREFIGLYRDQMVAAPATIRPLGAGELRPVFSRAGQSILSHRNRDFKTNTLDIRGIVKSLFGSFGRVESRELKALLIYAHSCLLLDPFAHRPELDRDILEEIDHPLLSNWGHFAELRDIMLETRHPLEDRVFQFADILLGISILEPLIRDGTVAVVPPIDPHRLYFGDELSLRSVISFNLYLLGAVPSPRHPDAAAISQVLIVRAKEQLLALLAWGDTSTVFAAGSFDEMALDFMIRGMIECGSIPPTVVDRSTDDRRLTTLASLQLPGVDRIVPKDMVTVRREDCFEMFRSDVRAGLGNADQETDVASSRQAFADEMRAARQRLDAGVKRSPIDRAIGGDTVAWAVGSLVGWSIAGWKGAVLGLAAKAVLEISRERATGPAALKNHYLALS